MILTDFLRMILVSKRNMILYTALALQITYDDVIMLYSSYI
jgi:hypothetical protein